MQNGTTTPQGVFFTTKAQAQTFAEYSDKDLVEVDGGWLAQNRELSTAPMPTRVGDVIVRRTALIFHVWTVRENDSQTQDPDAYWTWNWAHAADRAREATIETGGRVFLASNKGWTLRSTLS